MKLIKILFILFLINICSYVEAQQTISNPDLNELTSYLKISDFNNFYSKLNKSNYSNSTKIKYLLEFKNEGYTPLYWMLSELYANENNNEETQIWAYIAIIMTDQDSNLCMDETATNAVGKLISINEKTYSIILKTKQNTKEITKKAIQFIKDLDKRKSPKWACYYGNENNLQLKPQQSWQSIRYNILSKYMGLTK